MSNSSTSHRRRFDRSPSGQIIAGLVGAVFGGVAGIVVLQAVGMTTKEELAVFAASFAATFVGMMLSDEANSRLKSGALSGLTGAAAGGLGAVLADSNVLLLVGLAGSGAGLFFGWLVALLLCTAAGLRRGDHMRYMLTYFTTGLSRLKEELEDDRRRVSDERVTAPLLDWQEHFSYRIKFDTDRLRESPDPHELIQTLIRSWMVQVVGFLSLIFRLTDRDDYSPRMSVILFNRSCVPEDAGVSDTHGRHWVVEYHRLRPFDLATSFTSQSTAFKVCARLLNSPYFSRTGQEGDPRSGRGHPYYLFRVSSKMCVSVDWPLLTEPTLASEAIESNLFIQLTKSLVERQICPQLREVYDMFRDDYPPFLGSAAQPPAVRAGARGRN